MPASPSQTQALTLNQILWQLEIDHLINAQDAKNLMQTPKGQKQAKQHPLETIADAKLVQPNGDPLTLDTLLHWLANWSNQALFQIDPLK